LIHLFLISHTDNEDGTTKDIAISALVISLVALCASGYLVYLSVNINTKQVSDPTGKSESDIQMTSINPMST
jgi:threonine/homoserine/homoserine lactone efflux protein